jgi:MFS family permease
VLFTLVGSFLVDRAGRRVLLLTSISGMTLCTIALGVYFFILENDPASASAIVWLPLTSLGVFLAFFAIGEAFRCGIADAIL